MEESKVLLNLLPTFDHDCLDCVFLGTYECDLNDWHDLYDLYWCPNNEGNGLIARFGDKKEDIYSGELTTLFVPALMVANELAIEKGILTDIED